MHISKKKEKILLKGSLQYYSILVKSLV